MSKRSGKRKNEDLNQTAHRIVTEATGGDQNPLPEPAKKKNPAAVELGRRGGRVGGRKRAQNLTKEQLSEIGKLGAQARWKKPTE